MLKKLLITSVCLATISFPNFANATIEDDLANICAIVKANDKGELRKKMRKVQSNHSIKLRDYYTGISCGENSLIRVAILNNALEAGTLLVKKMPKKSLAVAESDGKTLLAWINEQGLADNPVALVVKDRM
jgi:UDP-N-acetylglucosamine pyrophosphorylase